MSSLVRATRLIIYRQDGNPGRAMLRIPHGSDLVLAQDWRHISTCLHRYYMRIFVENGTVIIDRDMAENKVGVHFANLARELFRFSTKLIKQEVEEAAFLGQEIPDDYNKNEPDNKY